MTSYYTIQSQEDEDGSRRYMHLWVETPGDPHQIHWSDDLALATKFDRMEDAENLMMPGCYLTRTAPVDDLQTRLDELLMGKVAA